MVDLEVQLVGSEERAPAAEDGVCYLENANVGLRIGRREPANKFLGSHGKHEVVRAQHFAPTCVKVSHRRQKSESAMTLMASPSCVWTLEGEAIMRPIRRSLMVATSS